MVTFQEVRLEAWDELHSTIWGNDANPIYCTMQERHAELHIGVYCNALSHVEALNELLLLADWCDDIEMRANQADEVDSERLLRLYSIVFLLIEECHQDLIDISTTVGFEPPKTLMPVKAFVNNVLKHRRTKSRGVVGGFHVSNHHGPYFFADDPDHSTDLPSELTSIDNFGELSAGTVAAVLMPSLVTTVAALADAIVALAAATGTPEASKKIEQEYGRPLLS